MGYALKLSQANTLELIEFPKTDVLHTLQKAVSEECSTIERVCPERLYAELGIKRQVTKIDGESVCMIVDEEGLFKEDYLCNTVACYLYKTEEHGNPIVGNVLFVGEKYENDGIDFCGIEEKVLKILLGKLSYLVAVVNDYNKKREVEG